MVLVFLVITIITIIFKAKSWYYHYTDNDSMKKIFDSCYIRASTDTINDAIYGRGVYLTTLNPTDNTKETIAENNYTAALGNQKLMEGKVDTCIGLFLRNNQVKNESKDDRNVYVYRRDLYLSSVKYMRDTGCIKFFIGFPC